MKRPALFLPNSTPSPLDSYCSAEYVIRTITTTHRGHTETVTRKVKSVFSAITLKNPATGEIIFAFRGTDTFGDKVGADLQISTGSSHGLIEQFKEARQFVFETLNEHGSMRHGSQDALNQDSKASFIGHSLGGGIAQYMTYVTADQDKNDFGVRSVIFKRSWYWADS